MATRKVKKLKRRLKIKNIIVFLIILILMVNFIYIFLTSPIKNIYIIGNNVISDDVIIDRANISDYPSFILTSGYVIKKRLSSEPYISNVKIKKKWWGKLYVYIEEYRPLCFEVATNKIILSNGDKVDNIYNIDEVPFLMNDVTDIYDSFIKKFSLVDKEALLQISEINYSPVNVDKERFYLSMNDGNYVYVTLTKIKRLNKYSEIKEEMNGKNGIIYLDSGNFIELKDY